MLPPTRVEEARTAARRFFAPFRPMGKTGLPPSSLQDVVGAGEGDGVRVVVVVVTCPWTQRTVSYASTVPARRPLTGVAVE